MTNQERKQELPILYSNRAVEQSSQGHKFVFLYKKTERISAALYMVTSLFHHDEPLRISIRQKATNLIEFFSSSWRVAGSFDARREELRDIIADLISYLNLATAGGLVSEMNAGVIARELELLDERISGLSGKEGESAAFSQSYFGDFTEEDFQQGNDHDHLSADADKARSERVGSSSKARAETRIQQGGGSGRQKKRKETEDTRSNTMQGKKPAVEAKKSKRQREILKLIKEKGEISVKDAARVVSNCSEKTLQRELASLINEGVLKKEGRRRWTRYSFA